MATRCAQPRTCLSTCKGVVRPGRLHCRASNYTHRQHCPPQTLGPCGPNAWHSLARPHAKSQVRRAHSTQVSATGSSTGEPPAMLMFELEGVVIDMHMDGHRAAFNAAFQDLGYDCVQWPMHVYHDLLSIGDGSPETMITNYFTMMGWPTMLATSDQQLFVKKVHSAKQAALVKMLQQGKVPLRTGVKQVIEDAIGAGASVVFISGTMSEVQDLVISNALSQLSPDAASKVRVFGSGVVKQDARYSPEPDASESSDEDGGEGPVTDLSSPGAMLREKQMIAKQQTAQQFVQGLRAMGDGDAFTSIHLDPSLMAMSTRRVSPELLAAVAAMQGLPMSRCIMLAATNNLTEAAASAGIVAVAVPRKMAERGSFNGARAKFTGFGAGDCTWGRLTHFLRATPSPA